MGREFQLRGCHFTVVLHYFAHCVGSSNRDDPQKWLLCPHVAKYLESLGERHFLLGRHFVEIFNNNCSAPMSPASR